MSIQKNSYTSKKTGITKIQYYASVWYAEEKRPIIGPMRETEKLARQDETDIQREIEAGRAKAPAKKRRMTVDTVYEEWHKATTPPVYSHNTWSTYGRFYKDYIREAFGGQPIGKIEPIHIQRYVNIIKEKLGAETVNKCLNILSDIFGFAIKVLKCITQNPVTGIPRCAVPKKNKVTWTDKQIAYFLSLPSVQKSHYYPMLCLSAALGARPGEVCGLRDNCLIADPCFIIDFDRGYDNEEHETDMKTSGSHRTPPIPQYLYKMLRKRLIWKKECQLAIYGWGKNDYLFVSQKGNPIKPKQFARGFKRLLLAHNEQMETYKAEHGKLPDGAIELPYLTLYGFRTSFATNNMRRTPNAALISSIMGNSPKTLLQFYTQTDLEMQTEIVEGYIDLEEAT